jgi:hypothetical protein
MRKCEFIETMKSLHTFVLPDFEQQYNPVLAIMSAVRPKYRKLLN